MPPTAKNESCMPISKNKIGSKKRKIQRAVSPNELKILEERFIERPIKIKVNIMAERITDGDNPVRNA